MASSGGPDARQGDGMFLGEHQHTLDEKGRIVLPAKHRQGLADGLVLTKGQDRCLYVFPIERWNEEVSRVNALPRTDRRARNFARAFFAGADRQNLDSQGRITVPPHLRDYAGLGREVKVLGGGDRVELWDVGTWETVQPEADEYYAGIEEALSDHGI
ncbi:MAG: division/cell wall cluster transcriptional repressor MraZ [Acidimicrobiia bacterium]